MKNKGTYILVPLVIIIWAVIGYRLFKYLNADKVEIHEAKKAELHILQQNFTPDTFSILANYRDPFLNVNNTPARVHKTVGPLSKPVVKSDKPWPAIAYHGLIKNDALNRAYAMISINNKLKNLAVNDEFDGVQVINMNRDSICVSFNMERRTFGLSKKKDEKAPKQTGH